jgi:hypothetical protein
MFSPATIAWLSLQNFDQYQAMYLPIFSTMPHLISRRSHKSKKLCVIAIDIIIILNAAAAKNPGPNFCDFLVENGGLGTRTKVEEGPLWRNCL